MVKIVFASALVSATGGERELNLDFSGDIDALLGVLKSRYGETFEKRFFDNGVLRKYLNVYVNGKDMRFMQGHGTMVCGDCEVLFLPAVSGG